MADVYEISTLADLFKVPAERRAAMFRDLEYGLALQELAHGENAAARFHGLTWRDDDNHSVELTNAATGEVVLTLSVTDGDQE